MITDVFDLRRTTEPGFLPIRQHSLKQMRVLRFLTRRINQARIRRRVLRFELLNRFEVGRVGHDFGKLLQLLQLVQLCFGLLLLNDSSAHDNSSLFWLKPNVRPNKRSTTTKSTRRAQLGATRFAVSRRKSKRPSSVKQMRILPKAPHLSVANQSPREQNCFRVPTLDREICDIRLRRRQAR